MQPVKISPKEDQPLDMSYRDLLNLNVRLLWCYDRPYLPSWAPSAASLEYSEYTNSGAWLIREGWGEVEYDGHVIRVQAGQWLVVKPGRRVQRFSPDARLLSIAFDAHWPDGTPLFNEGLSLVINSAEVPLLEKRALAIVKITNRTDAFSFQLHQNLITLRRFMELQRALFHWMIVMTDALSERGLQHSGRADIDPRVMAAIRLLRAHDPGKPLSQEQLGASVGLSFSQLVRLFRRDTLTTPNLYFERLRVEYACMRLRWRGVRVKEVAIEMGFTYLSHFSKWFRNHTGKSPREFTSG